ncbi:MAG: non-hydrolyzing UDP-N-acetylglucosamine 2-epimerase [Roseateles sp.]|uniref:non-hydrolyzing UDP-N-acetylglucosamine 2-epimerase n=1 Tax=Roseateles sp. TaxID=1971397 RepID=UPI004035DA7A
MRRKRILTVVGTRPEAIKMAPVITALQASGWCDCTVLATGQHRELLDQVLQVFGLVPDADLQVMAPNQSLAALSARLLCALDGAIEHWRPDVLIAQGDTTSVLCAAMAAFYRRLPFAHIEAGLRTHDLDNPFPEEMNRVVAGLLTRWHFSPTESARENLLAERIPADRIHVTGNTVIDALHSVAERADRAHLFARPGRRLILVTAHRRENFGAPLAEICRAIAQLASLRPETDFLFPWHPNPNVRGIVRPLLEGLPNVTLCEPLDYLAFVAAMRQSHLILSDSGGVQEEAPALAKPVLVLRRETERPEAVAAGVVRLVGHDFDTIVQSTLSLLDDAAAHAAMARGVSPYGDGQAASRIEQILRKALAQ